MTWHHIGNTKVLAKKRHRCVWCGEIIYVGEQYERQVGRFDGEFQSNAWHLECSDACAANWDAQTYGFDPYEQERPRRTTTGRDAEREA